jgi:hypothetical protein
VGVRFVTGVLVVINSGVDVEVATGYVVWADVGVAGFGGWVALGMGVLVGRGVAAGGMPWDGCGVTVGTGVCNPASMVAKLPGALVESGSSMISFTNAIATGWMLRLRGSAL